MIGGPLAFLIGMLTPSPSFGEIKARVRPNAYAHAMPAQAAIASTPTIRGALRGGLSGLTGSEADYAQEQATGNAALGGPLAAVNDGLTSRVPQPASWYDPNLPAGLIEGRGTGYVTDAYNKGWVNLVPGDGRSWGSATGLGSQPNIQPATLLVPTDKTPLPSNVAAAYAATNRGRTRLSDMFGD